MSVQPEQTKVRNFTPRSSRYLLNFVNKPVCELQSAFKLLIRQAFEEVQQGMRKKVIVNQILSKKTSAGPGYTESKIAVLKQKTLSPAEYKNVCI